MERDVKEMLATIHGAFHTVATEEAEEQMGSKSARVQVQVASLAKNNPNNTETEEVQYDIKPRRGGAGGGEDEKADEEKNEEDVEGAKEENVEEGNGEEQNVEEARREEG